VHRTACLFWLGVTGLACHAIPQEIDASTVAQPRGRFVFDAGGGAPPVHVWYARPNVASAKSRVLFLMHGSSRTGEEALDLGSPFSAEHDYMLLCPEFRESDYPGDRYSFGNMTDASGKIQDRRRWAFAVIERLFDQVRKALALDTTAYDIVGHSAGGQFVQRLVLFGPSSRFRRAVASTPGRYALPTLKEPFPYGAGGSGLAPAGLAAAFRRDFVLVLGERDTTDAAREPEAMKQGTNRFARGLRFFALATEEASAIQAPLGWRLRIVKEADHTPGAMVKAALAEVLP
jgi:pimeloyl-ACP methyl ester carboxylesterase